MQPQQPDHYDADLLLRLYDLRREEKLRRAREWFATEFQADSLEDLQKRFPIGTEENTYFRMVISYWEMAASLLNHGLIHEDLFFENNGEFWAVWARIEKFVPEIRKTWKNPTAYKNLEDASRKYEKWVEKRAPEALAFRREFLQKLTAKKT